MTDPNERLCYIEQRMDEAEAVSREDEERLDNLELAVSDMRPKVDRLVQMLVTISESLDAARRAHH